MRKLFLKLTLLLLPFFVIIATVNYYIDPAILFHSGYEAKMAIIMLDGKNVKSIANSNDRILQIELIKRIKKVPDTSVIGGSKVMMVSGRILESIFGQGKYLNNSMSQATLQDYIGVIDMYKKKGQLPKNILFSTDPHILSPIYQNEMYKPFEEYNAKAAWYLNKNMLELFSFSYFQNSIKAFYAGENTVSPVATMDTSGNASAIKLSDGRRVYSKRVLAATVQQSNAMALKSARGIVQNSGNTRDLDKAKIKKFENMITFLQNKGVKIAFFMPPYHPIVYKKIENTDVREIADKSENWFLSFANAHDIPVYGSYDPAFTGCIEADYFDNGHLRSESVAKAFKIR